MDSPSASTGVTLPSLLVPCAIIDDSGRLRQDYSHVEELAASIAANGQLQPVVLSGDNRLVAGGSRLRAVRDVLKRTHIAAVYLETLPEDRLRMLEVEENVRRKDFTWQERVLGVVRVHELRHRHGILSGEAERWTQRQTGELLGLSVGHVNNCLLLARAIRAGDSEVMAANGVTDAIKILLKRKEDEATKLLARATLNGVPKPKAPVIPVPISDDELFAKLPVGTTPPPTVPLLGGSAIRSPSPADEDPRPLSAQVEGERSEPEQGTKEQPVVVPLSSTLFLGDCISHMNNGLIAPESVDHVITDIPYGIDMRMLQQENSGMDVSSTAAEHDVEDNVELMFQLLPAIYRILKPNAFALLWYDLDHHDYLQTLARKAGFGVQRWPIYWVKTHPCLNQSAQSNFTKSVETCMLLRKGTATLVSPQSTNWWLGGNEDAKTRFNHPFAKPTKLWQWLAKAVAIQGATIYDPFAGVGSSCVSLLESGYKVLGSELNEDHYNRLVINVSQHYRSIFPNVVFH